MDDLKDSTWTACMLPDDPFEERETQDELHRPGRARRLRFGPSGGWLECSITPHELHGARSSPWTVAATPWGGVVCQRIIQHSFLTGECQWLACDQLRKNGTVVNRTLFRRTPCSWDGPGLEADGRHPLPTSTAFTESRLEGASRAPDVRSDAHAERGDLRLRRAQSAFPCSVAARDAEGRDTTASSPCAYCQQHG
jgi:hypothetical protein